MIGGRAVHAVALAAALLCTACASNSGGGGRGSDADHYLRYSSFRHPVSKENFLLRWRSRKMPLRVHLPRPPEGQFTDPEAMFDTVRDGITDWSDVAAPGIPSFVFVESAGDADIPIVWAAKPDGDWYIAYCSYDVNVFAQTFDVDYILVTGRYGSGAEATLHDLYATMLHEVGHALGIGGHSPSTGDIMYRSAGAKKTPGLSARDRETLRRLYGSPVGRRIVGAKSAD